jgi:hypothetical protein
MQSIVDPDPGRVLFASFCRIGIDIQNTENYDTFDTDERDKTLETDKAVTESKKNPTCVKLGVRPA